MRRGSSPAAMLLLGASVEASKLGRIAKRPARSKRVPEPEESVSLPRIAPDQQMPQAAGASSTDIPFLTHVSVESRLEREPKPPLPGMNRGRRFHLPSGVLPGPADSSSDYFTLAGVEVSAFETSRGTSTDRSLGSFGSSFLG